MSLQSNWKKTNVTNYNMKITNACELKTINYSWLGEAFVAGVMDMGWGLKSFSGVEWCVQCFLFDRTGMPTRKLDKKLSSGSSIFLRRRWKCKNRPIKIFGGAENAKTDQ